MAINMDRLNVFLQMGGAARAGVVVVGEKLGLYRARPKGPSELTSKTETRAAERNGARGGIRAHNPDH
jgi:hypothetical protein